MRLRVLTGLHSAVQDFVQLDKLTSFVLGEAEAAWARGDTEIVFTCFGGRHRSVACAELFAKYMRERGVKVVTEHVTLRELGVVAA